MKAKIDLEKFICSYVKWSNIQDALKDQGLKCWNGEIVEIPQESEDERIKKEILELVSISGNGNQFEEIKDWLEKQKPIETKPHRPNGAIPYDRGFEEAQEYLSKRGFDIPWNDCDVFVDERHITQTIANVLTWADEHPKQKPVEWRNEDDMIFNELYDFLINKKTVLQRDCNIYAHWIESLKQRMEEQQ